MAENEVGVAVDVHKVSKPHRDLCSSRKMRLTPGSWTGITNISNLSNLTDLYAFLRSRRSSPTHHSWEGLWQPSGSGSDTIAYVSPHASNGLPCPM